MTHQRRMTPDPPVTSTVPFPLMVAPPPMCAARTKLNQPAVSTAHQTYIKSSGFQPCVMPTTRPCPPMPGWSRAFTMGATPDMSAFRHTYLTRSGTSNLPPNPLLLTQPLTPHPPPTHSPLN